MMSQLAMDMLWVVVLLLLLNAADAYTNYTILDSGAYTTNNTKYSIIPVRNRNVVCRPHNKAKLASFALDHFNDARNLLNIPSIGANMDDYEELVQLYRLSQFFLFNKRINVFHTAGKVPIGYAQILKCASQNILQNLGQVYSKGKERHDFKSQLDYDFFKSLLKLKLPNDYEPTSKIFTFVRDPIEHFLAGFAQIIWKNFDELVGGWINKKKIKEYLVQIASTNFRVLTVMEHVYLMSGVFFEFDIDIVGYLETFNDDWDHVIKPYFNLNKKHDAHLGSHAVSQKSSNRASIKKRSIKNMRSYNKSTVVPVGASTNYLDARDQLRSLLKEDVIYKKVLCEILLVDYVCLPIYKLPAECSYLEADVNNIRALL